MRRNLTPFLPLLTLFIVGAAGLAAASECDFIHDEDSKSLCQAQSQHRASTCELIHSTDLKSYCQATVGEHRSHCDFIHDADLKSRCRAQLAPASSGSSGCDFIKDEDEKAFCRARASRNPSGCDFIHDADRKTYCHATVRQRRSDCAFIHDSDLKNRCLASVGGNSRPPAEEAPREVRCEPLSDGDERTACLAHKAHDPSRCGVIKGRILREQCEHNAHP